MCDVIWGATKPTTCLLEPFRQETSIAILTTLFPTGTSGKACYLMYATSSRAAMHVIGRALLQLHEERFFSGLTMGSSLPARGVPKFKHMSHPSRSLSAGDMGTPCCADLFCIFTFSRLVSCVTVTMVRHVRLGERADGHWGVGTDISERRGEGDYIFFEVPADK